MKSEIIDDLKAEDRDLLDYVLDYLPHQVLKRKVPLIKQVEEPSVLNDDDWVEGELESFFAGEVLMLLVKVEIIILSLIQVGRALIHH